MDDGFENVFEKYKTCGKNGYVPVWLLIIHGTRFLSRKTLRYRMEESLHFSFTCLENRKSLPLRIRKKKI
jgi:hypothetical protein